MHLTGINYCSEYTMLRCKSKSMAEQAAQNGELKKHLTLSLPNRQMYKKAASSTFSTDN